MWSWPAQISPASKKWWKAFRTRLVMMARSPEHPLPPLEEMEGQHPPPSSGSETLAQCIWCGSVGEAPTPRVSLLGHWNPPHWTDICTHLHHDQHNDDELQSTVMLIIKVIFQQLHQLVAMLQFDIHHLKEYYQHHYMSFLWRFYDCSVGSWRRAMFSNPISVHVMCLHCIERRWGST